MKATRIVRAIAIAATGALGLSAFTAPAQAATRTTVVVHASNALTSFNTGIPGNNLVTNSDVGYLTGAGFNYYDNKRNLVKNTTFGTYGILAKVPNTCPTGTTFATKWTVKPGRVWSDGTPINGIDLLLGHITASSEYSKAAGLGDPAGSDVPSFNSSGYGGLYDENIKGVVLGDSNMSLTQCFGKFLPDWEISGPGPSPVHTLVHLANNKTGLQTAAENLAAKNAFLADFRDAVSGSGATKTNAQNDLKAIGEKWSTVYNIKTVDSSTNDLLFVGNGGYTVTAATANQSVTLTKNARYNSGPALKGNIATIQFKFIGDGTAAAQALANKELDIYAGQPTADAVAALQALKGVKTVGGTNACFEHIDVRVDTSQFASDYYGNDPVVPYTGPFKGMTQRAKDMRTAFLLAYPRQDIVDTLVAPVNENAVVVNSAFLLPGQTGYDAVVKGSGVQKFIKGTQAQRTAAALALVKKYYPSAKANSKTVKVKLLWGQPSNVRRQNEFAIARFELAKAGFDLTNAGGTAGWSNYFDDSSYDAMFFAWCPSSVSQTGTNANFKSDGGNNSLGYNSKAMDDILKKLEGKLSPADLTKTYVAADKQLITDAVTLSIFQHPAVTAYNAALKNVKPAPLTPNLVWNYWEWTY
ncbi:MAG: hypothetical protein RLZZ400_673 [Actinomycetota bacterium]|jgi:peptide/nickel transport system substrate-binding protein